MIPNQQYQQNQAQQPKEQNYILKKDLIRKILPKTIEMFVLSILFYSDG